MTLLSSVETLYSKIGLIFYEVCTTDHYFPAYYCEAALKHSVLYKAL